MERYQLMNAEGGSIKIFVVLRSGRTQDLNAEREGINIFVALRWAKPPKNVSKKYV